MPVKASNPLFTIENNDPPMNKTMFKASEINKTAVMIIVLRFQKIRHKNLKILYIYRLLEKVNLRVQASGKRLYIILFHQLGFIDNL